MTTADDLLILGDGPGARETAKAAMRRGLRVRQVVAPRGTGPGSAPGAATLIPPPGLTSFGANWPGFFWPWPFDPGLASTEAAADEPWPVVCGTAVLTGDGGVMVGPRAAAAVLWAPRLVLAPRARPLRPAWWTATASLPGAELPDDAGVLVLGGGHTGVELAAAWAGRSGPVTLVEAGPRLLPGWDDDVAAAVAAALEAHGVTILTGCRAIAVTGASGALAVRLRRGGSAEDDASDCGASDNGASDNNELQASVVLPALGWRPDLDGCAVSDTRALADRRGFLQVDSRLETAEPRLHALGAAIAVPLSPAVVARQVEVVVAAAVGERTAPLRYGTIVRLVQGPCPVLAAGLTAAAARERGFRVTSARAGDAGSWIRCVRDAESEAVLGLHGVGAGIEALAHAARQLLAGDTAPAVADQAWSARLNEASGRRPAGTEARDDR